MIGLLWILLLALAWTAVNGEFSGGQLAVGLVLGTLITLFVRGEGNDYLRKAAVLTGFIAFFLWELVVANLRMARDVLSPRPRFSPGVIAVPLDLESEGTITAFANLLTLTPGTLSLDISRDLKVLYIHDMYAADPEASREAVKSGFEQRIRRLAE
jgi:multicomponent Na+:H+ antiporter subunit E